MAVNEHSNRERMSENDNIIEVRNTSVSFDMDRGESRVLDDVDLDIRRDEIIGIVGESGSGKSMFASAILDAVVQPGQLTGKITYYPHPDKPVDILNLSESELRSRRWEDISMVFQGAMSSFNPTMKIQGHFEETIDAHNAPHDAGMDRAHELLNDLHLNAERVLSSYPHELSGGMTQRALIALSLVLEPDILVMDEPTAALDLLMQRSILTLLTKIKNKYDLTLIFITHDLPLVAELADRLAVLYAFEFIEVGPTDEILHHAAHPYTRSLLNATPNLAADVSEMHSIEGSSPDPVDPPTGCSYHPRCPLADETCVKSPPDFQDVNTDHKAACYHWEDAAKAVPVARAQESNQ